MFRCLSTCSLRKRVLLTKNLNKLRKKYEYRKTGTRTARKGDKQKKKQRPVHLRSKFVGLKDQIHENREITVTTSNFYPAS